MLFTSKIKKTLLGTFILALVSTNFVFLFTNQELITQDNSKIISMVKRIKPEYTSPIYAFNINSQYTNYTCQSLADLKEKNKNTKKGLLFFCIPCCDPNKIESIANQALSEEIQRKDSHYVFYHGQPLEFLLFQDIFEFLYKLLTQKSLDNFIALRLPTKDLMDDSNIYEFFLSRSLVGKIDDSKDLDRKLLLSVTPSFFSNNLLYFLYSSSEFPIKNTNLIKQVFEYFEISNFFKKYKKEIEQMQELLSTKQKDKTGLLLQISVPKMLTDYMSYKSLPEGMPSSGKKTSYRLNAYKNHPSILSKEFRLLLNPELFSPSNNIIMRRYYNKTPNTKKYKELRSSLFEKITKDIKSKDSTFSKTSKSFNNPFLQRNYNYYPKKFSWKWFKNKTQNLKSNIIGQL